MQNRSIGEARIEPTEETTTRVYVKRADGDETVLYLEPGNALTIVDDGPVVVEAAAMTDAERTA